MALQIEFLEHLAHVGRQVTTNGDDARGLILNEEPELQSQMPVLLGRRLLELGERLGGRDVLLGLHGGNASRS